MQVPTVQGNLQATADTVGSIDNLEAQRGEVEHSPTLNTIGAAGETGSQLIPTSIFLDH